MVLTVKMASPKTSSRARVQSLLHGRMGLPNGTIDERPLAEARVLYELGRRRTEICELRSALHIDAGQLSRLLKRLEEQGLLTREPSPSMPAGSRCG